MFRSSLTRFEYLCSKKAGYSATHSPLSSLFGVHPMSNPIDQLNDSAGKVASGSQICKHAPVNNCRWQHKDACYSETNHANRMSRLFHILKISIIEYIC